MSRDFGLIRSIELVSSDGWDGLQIDFVNLEPGDVDIIRMSIRQVLPTELANVCINFLPTKCIPPLRMLISNYQSCCEDFGFLIKPSPPTHVAIDDEKKEYGISGLLLTDRAPLNKSEWKALEETFNQKVLVSAEWGRSYSKDLGYFYQNTAEIVLRLDDGNTFGVLIWNDHNGYYSHSIRLERHGLSDEQEL